GEAKGIYVSEKNTLGFIVKELSNGNSNATFDWMVVAKRKSDEVVNAEETGNTEAPAEETNTDAPAGEVPTGDATASSTYSITDEGTVTQNQPPVENTTDTTPPLSEETIVPIIEPPLSESTTTTLSSL
ncbi:MAG: hypothetical protein WC430_03095, partial [Patescibacteria group bacterium]